MEAQELRRRSPYERRIREERSSSRRSDSYSRSRARNYSPERRREPRRSRRTDRISDRENPDQSRCLGVFGMSTRTKEEELRDVFSQFGPIEKVTIVYDAKTGHSRGYSFIYYESVDHARQARESCNNMEIGGKTIRVDYSLTERAHSPTPGMYMGNRRAVRYDREERRSGRDRDRSRGYGSSHRRERDSYNKRERIYSRRQRSYSRSPRR